MKKILTLMMAFAMVFCMAACGNTVSNDNASNSEPVTSYIISIIRPPQYAPKPCLV